jgi:hypothetical protein
MTEYMEWDGELTDANLIMAASLADEVLPQPQLEDSTNYSVVGCRYSRRFRIWGWSAPTLAQKMVFFTEFTENEISLESGIGYMHPNVWYKEIKDDS